MFEYTALVDAPVKRFTSIVTDSEPDEAPSTLALAAPAPPAPPAAPVATPGAEATVMPIAFESEATTEPVSTLPPPSPAAPAPRGLRTFVPRAEPAPAPSILPALIGIAAAGIAAMWILRRDSHQGR